MESTCHEARRSRRHPRGTDAGRAEDEDVFGAGDAAAGGELADELVVDRGLEAEVEVVESLHTREVRDLDVRGDALSLTRSERPALDDYVRGVQEPDLAEADRIMRPAFGSSLACEHRTWPSMPNKR